MIDLHCHVLPGLDDSAADLVEALAMVHIAVEDVIETIVATSHYDGADISFPARARTVLEWLNRAIRECGLPLDMHLGFELMLTPVLSDWGAEIRNLSLNRTHYLLGKLALSLWPPYVYDVMFRLQSHGVRPILAHAERYDAIFRNLQLARDLVERCVYLQVNSHRLLGRHGSQIQRSARTLVERGLVHIVASDAHASSGRTPGLSAVRDLLDHIVGPIPAIALVHENPAAVIANVDLPLRVPVRRQHRLFDFSRQWSRIRMGQRRG